MNQLRHHQPVQIRVAAVHAVVAAAVNAADVVRKTTARSMGDRNGPKRRGATISSNSSNRPKWKTFQISLFRSTKKTDDKQKHSNKIHEPKMVVQNRNREKDAMV